MSSQYHVNDADTDRVGITNKYNLHLPENPSFYSKNGGSFASKINQKCQLLSLGDSTLHELGIHKNSVGKYF